MSAHSLPFLLLYTQNAFTSLPFILAFLVLLVSTGAWFIFSFILVVAFALHLAFNSLANGLSNPTPREAVLITGCSSGVGEAAALHLASVGYTVFATVRTDEDAQALTRSAGHSSHRIVPVMMDITQQQSVDAALADVSRRVANEGLSLRVLINNAGGLVTGSFGGFELLPIDLLQQSYAFNVCSQLRVTQAFLPMLRATAGRGERARIVFTSSISGVLPVPCLGSYSSAKAAIENMADCLRMELRSAHIDVCVVQPGNLDTPTTDGHLLRGSPSIDDMAATNPHVDRSLLAHYDKLNTTFQQKWKAVSKQSVASLVRVHEHIVRARWVEARYVFGWDAMMGVHVLRRLPALLRDYTMMVNTIGW